MNHHVAALVARLHEQPSHTGSLIVTLFGDALLPRGSAIALATILDLFESLGIGPGVIRTAISRLAADGWLVASRRGRSSYYRIGPSRRGEFIRAARHIYGRPRGTAARSLIIALPEPGPGREPARERFNRLGFASWQGILLAPDRPLPRSLEAGSIVLRATGGPESLRRLAARAWRLDALCDHYKGFLAIFGGLTADAPAFDPRDALLARLLLIHDYRRIVLRDPRLPATFLPEEWAGDGARRLCAQLYEAILDASELWLSHNGATETGALPTADSTLRHRFADLRGHV
ncbi:PaaX family transcriptional regulator C-terminal domain-containing protein [Acidiphilium sp.]|uniref:PaaX family transcriptional regulator C-terminal domain-containing protein n=1 Tax=Acidiphilium sp. TaxID=527 RepID=UPI003D053AAF